MSTLTTKAVQFAERMIRRRAQEKKSELDSKAATERTVIAQLAYDALGQPSPFMLSDDEAYPVYKAIDPELLARNIERAKRRILDAPKAERADELQAAAQAAERALCEHNAEWQPKIEAARKLANELRLAAERANLEATEAIKARAEMLASATVTDEEISLAEQASEVSFAIDRCNRTLYHLGGAESAVSQIRLRNEALRNDRLSTTDRKRIEAERDHYQKVADNARKELAALEKQRDGIAAKLKQLEVEKLRPENFAIIRAKKTAVKA